MRTDFIMALSRIAVLGMILSTTALKFEMFSGNMCELLDDDITKPDTSYSGCLDHCQNRTDCVAVNFMQKTSLCRLNFRMVTPGICQGYVYSRKDAWKMDSGDVCKCPLGKRCNQNGECVISECDKLAAPDHGRVYGTQFSVGDKVAFLCNPGYVPNQTKRRACLPHTGTWSGENITCIEDETCTDYLVSGPDGVRDEQLSDSGYWCKSRPCGGTIGTDSMSAMCQCHRAFHRILVCGKCFHQ